MGTGTGLITAASGPPVVGDDELVAFLGSVELVASRLYASADSRLTSPAARAAAAAFGAHHDAHAAALAALTGTAALRPNQALLSNLAASLQTVRTEQDELLFLASLEEQLAATYQWMVGRLTGPGVLGQAATILPVECQHAVVLGTLTGKPVTTLVPGVQSDTGFLNPDDFPVA